MPPNKERILFYTGVTCLSLGVSLTIIIALSINPDYPMSISSLVTDWNTPQARVFTSLVTITSICLLFSWCLYLPPYSTIDIIHHLGYCICLYLVTFITVSIPLESSLENTSFILYVA